MSFTAHSADDNIAAYNTVKTRSRRSRSRLLIPRSTCALGVRGIAA